MSSEFNSPDYSQSIAIIGMSGRFPGAHSLSMFWDNLANGIESISFFDTFLSDDLRSSSDDKQEHFVKAFGALKNLDKFDAGFFNFTPREAELTDPQRRFLLECCYEALESAGYATNTYQGRIAVYLGEGFSDYFMNNLSFLYRIDNREQVDFLQLLIGNFKDFAATQVSYKLNLRGPSISISTTCSTSLVAIHEACKSLFIGEADIAIAGGVRIAIPEDKGYLYQEGGINSPDGHCRAFDINAAGTVGGNGVGIVILKRYEDAIRDNDTIHALIIGSAVNNDGANKVGYTAPSVDGQALVISEAHAFAGISSETIRYIEAHGTGTVLGDPIEIEALTKAFRQTTKKSEFCALGSLKTNIGHLDVAAGVAGLIKTVLALKNKKIPPSLNFTQPNPRINFKDTPFYVNTTLKPWVKTNFPRRAGVSSFGIGGTNAHVVLEEAPEVNISKTNRSYHILPISAKTKESFLKATSSFVEYCKQNTEPLEDIAYTLQVGRRPYSYRKTIICNDIKNIPTNLEDYESTYSKIGEINNLNTIFMFPGQGSQHVYMGKQLYNEEPVFKETLLQCSKILKSIINLDIINIIYPSEEHKSSSISLMKQTYVAQPVLFSLEYALAQLWSSWGVLPSMMIGHSLGEYVAACLSEVFTLEDALLLVAQRGKMMQSMPFGSMISIPLPLEEVRKILPEALDITAINGVSSCVVGGPSEEIKKFIDYLKEKNILCKELYTSHAFHTRSIDTIKENFLKILSTIPLSSPKIPYISNFTGTFITEEEATNPIYWINQARYTVQFYEGIKKLFKDKNSFFLEVGPNKVLSTLATLSFPEEAHRIVNSLPPVNEEYTDKKSILEALGKLWEAGSNINWNTLYSQEKRRRIPLPTYPFKKESYWVEPEPEAKKSNEEQIVTGNLFYKPAWRRRNLQGHLIQESNLKDCWLIFIHPSEKDIIQSFKKLNVPLIFVYPSPKFQKYCETEYSINPEVHEDYKKLFENIKIQNLTIKNIIHMWCLDKREDEDSSLEHALVEGLYSLIFIAKYVNTTNPIYLSIITNSLQQVTGIEKLNPAKSIALAPCKTIPQEYPEIRCVSIDVTRKEIYQDTDLFVQKIQKEFYNFLPDNVVSYRGFHRWVQEYESLVLNDLFLTNNLRQNGTYLITGGLGNIGLTLCEYLVKEINANVILLSRNIGKLQTDKQVYYEKILTNYKNKLFLYQADVSDLYQLSSVVEDIEKKQLSINGVIHAAGCMDLKTFKTINNINSIYDHQAHFSSKIQGLLNLEKTLRNTSYDFLLNVSSLSTILGGVGYTMYAAANLFLDSYTKLHNSTSKIIWTSINWEGWEFNKDKNLESTYRHNLTPKEGIKIFKNIFSYPFEDQLIIAKGSLDQRLSLYSNQKSRLDTLEVIESKGDVEKAPENIQAIIKGIWENLLGLKKISFDDNFFKLGGDSLLAIQAASLIRKRVNKEISVKNIFEFPSINLLTDFLNENERSIKEISLQNKLIDSIKEKDKQIVKRFPLSFSQQRLWFIEQSSSERKGLYNIAKAFHLRGDFNIKGLEYAINQVINRHEILRAAIISIDGRPEQQILKEAYITICEHDISHLRKEEQNRKLHFFINEEAWKPFDLEIAPLIRATLIRLNKTEAIFLFCISHLLCDEWALGIIFREISEFYNAYIFSYPVKLDNITYQYSDYVGEERAYLQGNTIKKQLEYWKKKLEGAPETLRLFISKPQREHDSILTLTYKLIIEESLYSQIKTFAKAEELTTFIILLTAFKILLYRYSLEKKCVVGTPIANRSFAHAEGLVGFLSNTLPLCTECDGNITILEYLQRVRETIIEAYEYQSTPFEKIVDYLKIKRNLQHHPLFQSWFVLHQLKGQPFFFHEVKAEPFLIGNKELKFDIFVAAIETSQDINIHFQYSRMAFDEGAFLDFIHDYKKIIKAICENSQTKIEDIFLSFEKVLLEHCQQEMIEAEKSSEISSNIITLFQKKVDFCPDRVAIYYDSQSITYKELNALANQIANFLDTQNVNQNSIIAIYYERSINLVAYILAILKTGNAFLVLDPNYPQNRLSMILKDSKAACLLCTTNEKLFFPEYSGKILDINYLETNLNKLSHIYNPKYEIKPEDIAYIIYTSGSQGIPKGIGISHRNLCHYVPTMIKILKIKQEDVYAHTASFSFSSSVRQLFCPLINGTSLAISTPVERKDPLEFFNFLLKYRISIIDITPTFLSAVAFFIKENNLLDKHNKERLKLRLILSASETLSSNMPVLWREIFGESINIKNMYGQSETTGIVTIFDIPKDNYNNTKVIPIGKPISGTYIFVLSENKKLLPPGGVGEIYVGGRTVADGGYIHNPMLTAESFIPNPLSKSSEDILYKTGDLGRVTSNGEIEHLGRKDNQIKIRGHRIELSEIESNLIRHKDVRQALVTNYEDYNKKKSLIAYIVPGMFKPSATELKQMLLYNLPDYMVPEVYVFLDAFPLTPNGKIDRGKLPMPEAQKEKESKDLIAPRNATEEKLCAIWCKVLGLKRISIQDNFFEIGGDSILSMQVVSQANQHGINLTVAQLFETPTIFQLSSILETLRKEPSSSILALDKNHYDSFDNIKDFLKEIGDQRKCIYPFQESGKNVPLFFIHPVGGIVEWYKELSHFLGNTQPFYGINSLYFKNVPRKLFSIQELAKSYIDEIYEIYPQGPYYIGGWSFGAAVAYEITKQLEEDNKEVILTFLLDLNANFHSLDIEGSLDSYLKQDLKSLKKAHDSLLEYQRNIAICNLLALKNYKLDKKIRKIVVFEANEYLDKTIKPKNNNLGWRAFSREAINYFRLSSNHYTLLKKPCVELVAKIISEHINKERR